jgi:HAE1 family hydrophobic/amphiphilic exporter-1
MGITRLAIRRPLTMLMIILGLIVLGYRSLTMLQVDRMPKMNLPYVSVVVVFPGASPEDVEDLVVKPIEDAVAGIAGIDHINSSANEGLGVVVISFVEGIDGNQAAIDVERQVATVRGQLPSDAQAPSVVKADINASPIMQVILNGPQGQDELFDLTENQIKPRLQAVDGVASVNISGGREREIQIYPDPARLAAFGLSLGTIQQALVANNLTFPVGSVEEGRQKTSIRSVGDFTNLEDIKNIVVAGGPKSGGGGGSQPATPGKDTGGWVYLRNVGTVQEGFKDQSQVLRYNGKEAVNINIIKTSDSNAIAVADNLRRVIEDFNARRLPAGAKMTVVIDTSDFTRQSVAAVQEDLILAILITGLVMLVFLHTIRSTFIVLLAIPTSIISTFLVMWALGFSLNSITLMALTLVIGILVDDSIVVIENIERHLKMKKKPTEAALDGRSEIGLAAITITLVDVVVYLPVAFTSGIVGQVFRSYGITIATTTAFSLFVSFTLTPMLAAQWLRDKSEPEQAPRGLRKVLGILLSPVAWLWNGFTRLWELGFNALSDFYAATLRFVLRNIFTQSLAVLVAAVALAGGLFMVASGVVQSEFFPQEDDGQFSVSIQMPAGTNLAATDQATRQVEQIILKEVPETVAVLTSIGSSGAGGMGSFIGSSGGANTASITVRLVDKTKRLRSVTAVVEAIRPLVKKIPEATISVNQTSAFGGGGMGGTISVQVYGEDMDKLIDLSDQVEAAVRSVPGTVDVLNTGAARSPETRIVINRNRALDLGLSPAQVAGTLRTALSGSKSGTYKPAGATEIDITVRMNEAIRSDFNQLLRLPLGYRNGQTVTLDQVSTIEHSQAPASISRTDRQRVLTISTGVSGRGAADVTNDVEAAIRKQVNFPAGYAFQFSGISQIQRQSFADLAAALILSIVLVYMLLVALFQSWLHPLAIMFSLPVALVGAFGGLWVTGKTLNMVSILGIILLVGVVTKNAILLVDFTNVLRQEHGYSRKAALVEAGRLRLRPILMTTAAIVFALLPLLLGVSAGSELRAPLAAAVIGGNISSTLLTLILVPVVYNFFDGGSARVSAFLRRLLGTGEEEAVEQRPVPVPPKPVPQPGPALTSRPASQSDATVS